MVSLCRQQPLRAGGKRWISPPTPPSFGRTRFCLPRRLVCTVPLPSPEPKQPKTSRTHPVEPWTPQSLRLPQRSVPLQTTLWPHLRGHLIPYYCVCYPLLLFVTSNGTPITTNQDACYYWWSDLNHQQPTTRTSPKLAEADLCGLSRWRRST